MKVRTQWPRFVLFLAAAGILAALPALAGAAGSQDSLLNASFTNGASGWETFGVTVATSGLDANGTAGSGSLIVRDDSPTDNGGFASISQCLPAFPTAPYLFGARTHIPLDQEPAVRVVALVRFYTTTNCVGGQIVGEATSDQLATPGNWRALVGRRVVAPLEARGVSISLGVRRVGDGAVPGEAHFDDAFLSPVLGNCEPSAQTVCLNRGRFAVEVAWQDSAGQTGTGQAQLLSPDTGSFWFFEPDNQELLVKVLDGCGVNQRVWVFSAATTDVAFTLSVTDAQTGQRRIYSNPLGTAAPATTDTAAFAACP